MILLIALVALLIHSSWATPPQTCTCQNADPSQFGGGFPGFPSFQPQPQPQAQPQFQPQPFQGFATPGPAALPGSCPPPIQFNCPPPPACPPPSACPPSTITPHPFFATHPFFTTTIGPTVAQTFQGQGQGQGTDCGGVTPAPGSYNSVDQQTAAPNYQQPQPLQPLPEQPQQVYPNQQGQYYQQGGQQPLPVAEQNQAQVQQPQTQPLPQQAQYQGQSSQYQGQQQYQGQEGQQAQAGQYQGQEGQEQEQGAQQQFPNGHRGSEMNIHVYREGENTQADYVEGEENAAGNTGAPKAGKEGGTMDYDTNNEVYKHRQKQLGAPTIDVIDETKCNNEKLRKIMVEVIDDNPSTSKRKIQKEAMEKIGGIFDVICSNGDFSYLANTRLYCETRVKDTICFAFLHNALP
ncbi:hypothetical protein QR680_004135 [Steinernema hermaphroditum]|uniref:Ground-like domain-containing protein n=1 Tax=Steinernema hermaphroditum TaxID=289476 RepID=A0AA39LSQ7_9BILA|nr:hypothetical protein QR680_004135 [Steinernema hermaphroditum]